MKAASVIEIFGRCAVVAPVGSRRACFSYLDVVEQLEALLKCKR